MCTDSLSSFCSIKCFTWLTIRDNLGIGNYGIWLRKTGHIRDYMDLWSVEDVDGYYVL
jgi:hypothetical protein